MIDETRWRIGLQVEDEAAEVARSQQAVTDATMKIRLDLERKAVDAALIRYRRAGGPLDAKLWQQTLTETRALLGLGS